MHRYPILAAALAAALSLASCASTTPILGPGGGELEGSLALLERVELNGRAEWITIRGRDETKPLLLFLAGGPGGTELASTRRVLGGLEEDFVVVNWDQPGAGKSYYAIDHGDLELEVYLEDAEALVELLLERFGRRRLFVLGESWGSVLGALLAQARPDRVAAFFGTGQMVAFEENDVACYELMLAWARERGDEAKVEKLERQGPPPYYGRNVSGRLSAFLLDTWDYSRDVLGVRSSGDTMGDIMSPEYTLLDKVHWITGLTETLDHFYPKLWDFDLRREAPRLEVPAFFLVGRLDVNASIPLFEDYYARLEAHRKEVVWFERSGHNPWSSETERFLAELRRLSESAAEGT